MDLESESSALEASVEVDDNGLIGEVETIDDKVVSASATVEADNDEKTITNLDKPSNSPVETCPLLTKGFGLRKWRRKRRIRRDVVKDDTCVNMEKSKAPKRVLSGAADPDAKQMHFPGPDVKQDSLGSVNSMAGFAIGGSSHGAGMDSDNSEDRGSMSSTAASGGPKVRYDRKMGQSWGKQRAKHLGGKSVISSGEERKSRVENSKEARGGERIKIEKENSHSSMESSDSRSSNFVFVQGASYSLSSRETGGRRMVDYNEENSDHDDAHTSNRRDRVGEEEEDEEGTGDHSQGESVEESQIKNNGSSDNLDPLKKAFNSYQNLQEALNKELQKFQELGKESILSPHDGAESSSCIHAGHEGASEASSSHLFGSENMKLTSLDSEILNLVNNVEHLETKLEETKCILEVKESQIRELESTVSVSGTRNGGTEISIEDIFQQKMEAEIEYIVFSRSVANLKRRIKVVEEEKILAESEAHKMLSKLGEAENKAENLKNQAQDLQNRCVEIQEVKSFKKRVFKTTSCLLLQLGLLFMLFSFQLMPESEIVVPT